MRVEKKSFSFDALETVDNYRHPEKGVFPSSISSSVFPYLCSPPTIIVILIFSGHVGFNFI